MEDTTSDFKDLLAAFDIPDMRVKISEVRSLAPVSSASDVAQTTPSESTSTTPIVKQEPCVNILEPTWQPVGQEDDASRHNEGSQELKAVVSVLDQAGTNISEASAALDTTQEESPKSTQNGSVANGEDIGMRSLFQRISETDFVQHSKVVSSTLQANSWANAKTQSLSVNLAPKPIRAQKAPPSLSCPTVRKGGRPALAAGSILVSKISQKKVVPSTTSITSTVRVAMGNNRQSLVIPVSRSSVPPLIFGRSGSQQAPSKTQVIGDATSSSPGSKSTAMVITSFLKVAENKKAKVAPEILLKRLNPIPKYIPKAKQFLGWSQSAQSGDTSMKRKRSQVTHPCDECGDIFLVESSLTLHMERRSVQIAFNCIFCLGRSLMFYNKCSFFAHLRKHSQMMKVNMNYASQIAKATVSSLSHMKGSQNVVVVPSELSKTISSENDATKSKVDTADPLPALTQISAKDSTSLTVKDAQPSVTEATAVPSTQEESLYKCNICKVMFKTHSTLLLHMQHQQKNLLKCQVCKMELPNVCQLKTHTMMHTDTSGKWVCPECSAKFNSLKMFSTHITNSCMHWYRQVRTECTLCSKYVVNYTDHLDKGHEMLFYRCVSCAMAFKTLQSLKEHSEQKHQVQPGSPLCRIISKCPFCETVFMQKPLLLAHIKGHISQDKQLKSKYIYNCHVCNTVFPGLTNLKKHLTGAHKFQKHFHCDFCRRRFLHYSDLLSHFKTGRPSGLFCKVANTVGNTVEYCKAYSSKRFERYQEPKAAKGTESNSSSEASESSSSNTSSDARPKEQALGKLYVKKTRSCPGCRKEGKVVFFQKETDLRSHMSLNHPEMKLSVINSDDCVKYITIKPKEGSPPDPYAQSEKTSPSQDESSRKRKASTDTAEEKPKQKKVKIILATEFDCAKCHHHSSDRLEFKVHIEGHRPDRSFSQCEECGICFRIEAALRKHLFIQHGIREFETYRQMLQGKSPSPTPDENGADPAPSQEPTPTKETPPKAVRTPARTETLECQVCYKTFQSEVTLRVHMRNHGMAFIRSKRSISSD